ncbi:MAG TPA: aminotransferase class V-fold PLP-dependent enzyme [Acidimicrobiales bacterium]|nr:aminotransferase class V-fold PLP-dependent enzyme [Acidimicrobiales bacterium]
MAADDLIAYIRDSVIGLDEVVDGPFGPRPVIYADYTASGRSLSFIEDHLRSVVLPLYANTHTESSGTGLQTTRFREEARDIIRRCVGATDEHAVLFCGSGSTYAIDRLIGVLGLRLACQLEDRYHLSRHIPADERPVVFVGPFEHHSNELPWRESIADVVTIGEDADGHVDLAHLEAELVRHADRPLKIGSFSAASNVTGIMTDTVAVSSLLHHHGALSFWDYAAAAPYVDIAMGAPADGPAYLDAIFVSPHKLIGGPGTPGLLVARKELFTNRVPDVPGGGTVRFVNPSEHDYLDDVEHREEGGTPAIVDSIRAGLVFQLKEAVGIDEIRAREERFVQLAIESWAANERIEVLGNHKAERLSIVSFVVRHDDPADGPVTYLHHNFVVAVLNDLFGIQARGGCSCAGPYGHRLLGIDLDRSHEFEREIDRGCEGIKPGWTRVNFNYFIDDDTFRYLLDAVHLVADEGHHLLPWYRFEPDSGLWRHRLGQGAPPLSLHDVSYATGAMTYPRHPHADAEVDFAALLAEARRLLARAAQDRPEPLPRPEVTPDFEHLRWFPFPDDAGG